MISSTNALIVPVHFFVVNSGPQYMQRPRDQRRHKTTSYVLFFTGVVQRTKRARLKIAASQESPSREGLIVQLRNAFRSLSQSAPESSYYPCLAERLLLVLNQKDHILGKEIGAQPFIP